jgi:hypothetical protein
VHAAMSLLFAVKVDAFVVSVAIVVVGCACIQRVEPSDLSFDDDKRTDRRNESRVSQSSVVRFVMMD